MECPYSRRDFAVSLLLAALLFRAYVPVGFMPASGTPFLLEICPAGLMASTHAHHQHSSGQAHFENCPFGSAPGAGPISQIIGFAPPASIAFLVAIPAAPIAFRARLHVASGLALER